MPEDFTRLKNVVRYVGLKNLTLLEQATLRKLAEKHYDKIYRNFKGNIVDLVLHIKTYDVQGRKKYSLHAKVEAPAKKVFTAKDADWDLRKVTQAVFDKLREELKKEFKENGKGWSKGIKEIVKRFWWR